MPRGRLRSFLAFVSSAILFCVTGCGSGSGGSAQTVSRTEIDPAQVAVAVTGLVEGAEVQWHWDSFIEDFGQLLSDKKYVLDVRKISYRSVGGNGMPAELSGLIILPRAVAGSPPAVPILMYQHTTELTRSLAPSRFVDNPTRPLGYPEVVLALAMASSGYAVAMADYEGLGDSSGTHPYLHGATLARQTVDMLRAAREVVGTASGQEASPCRWNGQLFLMGYSEGGYVTMVSARELQLNHPDFTVTAAAPLSGPHDLSGTMREVFLADTPYREPYLSAYLLRGYGYVYQSRTRAFDLPNSLAPPFNSTVPPLFEDDPSSEAINRTLGMTLQPLRLVTPRSFLSTEFIQQLADPSSLVVLLLRENDSYRGWAPAMPMLMIHHPADELVPFANSRVAFDAFSTAGAKRHVSLVSETAAIDLGNNPAGTVHAFAALPELSAAFRWLDRMKQ